MEKSKTSLRTPAISFVASELVLGVFIQLLGGDIKRVLCFLSIVISFVFSLIILDKSTKSVTTSVALFFTLISDALLVLVTPPVRTVAMLSFSMVQICYFLRLYLNTTSVKQRRIHLIVRCIAILVLIFACVVVLGGSCDLLSIISVFYFANLLTNLMFAFAERGESPLFPIGLLLFALCDIFVGFSVMSQLYFEFTEGTFLYYIANPEIDLAWLFYVPSQTLIPLSLIKGKLH